MCRLCRLVMLSWQEHCTVRLVFHLASHVVFQGARLRQILKLHKSAIVFVAVTADVLAAAPSLEGESGNAYVSVMRGSIYRGQGSIPFKSFVVARTLTPLLPNGEWSAAVDRTDAGRLRAFGGDRQNQLHAQLEPSGGVSPRSSGAQPRYGSARLPSQVSALFQIEMPG